MPLSFPPENIIRKNKFIASKEEKRQKHTKHKSKEVY